MTPLRRLRSRLSYANVTASLALFIALGGTGYAAVTLPRNSVGHAQLRNNAVGTKELRRGAVRTSDIRNRTIRAQRPRHAAPAASLARHARAPPARRARTPRPTGR